MATVAAVATAAVADAAMKHDMMNSPLWAVVLRRECVKNGGAAVPGVTPWLALATPLRGAGRQRGLVEAAE